MGYECFYCDKGKVESLPAKCPECLTDLKKPVKELTQEEYGKAVEQKLKMGYPLPAYTLAS